MLRRLCALRLPCNVRWLLGNEGSCATRTNSMTPFLTPTKAPAQTLETLLSISRYRLTPQCIAKCAAPCGTPLLSLLVGNSIGLDQCEPLQVARFGQQSGLKFPFELCSSRSSSRSHHPSSSSRSCRRHHPHRLPIHSHPAALPHNFRQVNCTDLQCLLFGLDRDRFCRGHGTGDCICGCLLLRSDCAPSPRHVVLMTGLELARA